MGKSIVTKKLQGVGSFVVPAGVKSITVHAVNVQPAVTGGIASGVQDVSVIGRSHAGVLVWGAGANGQVGDGSAVPRSSPIAIVGSLNVKKVVQGRHQNGFLSQTGVLTLWSEGGNGNLGNNNNVNQSSPVGIAGAPFWKDVFIPRTENNNAVFAIKEDGSVWAWGYGLAGAFGNNLSGATVRASSPIAAVSGRQFVELNAGGVDGVTFGWQRDGVAYSWGGNGAAAGASFSGMYGDGTVAGRSSPVATLNARTYAPRTMTPQRNGGIMILDSTGTPYGWGGDNDTGWIGAGTIAPQSSPVAAIGGHTFIKIAQNSGVAFGLKADGTIWSWGQNGSGGLGVGDILARSSPTAVIGGHVFVDIFNDQSSAGGQPICLKADGSLWMWGSGGSGALGNGTTTNFSSPVAVIGGHQFIAAYRISNTCFGLREDGTLMAWGQNAVGQLGIGTNDNRSSPVAVIGGYKWAEQRIPVAPPVVLPVAPGMSISYNLLNGLAPYFGAVSFPLCDQFTVQYNA